MFSNRPMKVLSTLILLVIFCTSQVLLRQITTPINQKETFTLIQL